MTWLDNIKSKDLQFENYRLEKRTREWIQNNKDREVFAGLLIRASWNNQNHVVAKITHIIPFPNNSKTPENSASPNGEWNDILKEIRDFYMQLNYEEHNEYLWMGWLHTHPHRAKAEFSDADLIFAGALAKESWYWNGHFMVLVAHSGKRTFRYTTKWVSQNNSVNDAEVSAVTFRSFFQWQYAF